MFLLLFFLTGYLDSLMTTLTSGVHDPPICILFKVEEETLNLLFTECNCVNEIWQHLLEALHFNFITYSTINFVNEFAPGWEKESVQFVKKTYNQVGVAFAKQSWFGDQLSILLSIDKMKSGPKIVKKRSSHSSFFGTFLKFICVLHQIQKSRIVKFFNLMIRVYCTQI